MGTYFEGTEKKLEIAVRPGVGSLRAWPDSFWARVVEATDARILSSVANEVCTAYLLSESSLFVYDDRMVMITCGRTRLTGAVPLVLERLPEDALDLFVYERKNEVFPHAQATSFFEDARELRRWVPGRAYQFGYEDEHHLYIYVLDRLPADTTPDVTVELLMYGLSAAARDHFRGPGRRADAVAAMGLAEALAEFTVDDHHFEPTGYSLNAIRDDRYFTVHVTPEDHASYASVETNARFGGGLDDVLHTCLDAFGPRSFDVVAWQRGRRVSLPDWGRPARTAVTQDLPCGYNVRFVHYGRELGDDRPAIELSEEILR